MPDSPELKHEGKGDIKTVITQSGPIGPLLMAIGVADVLAIIILSIWWLLK